MKTFHADITIKFNVLTERYVKNYLQFISRGNNDILSIQIKHSSLSAKTKPQQVQIDVALVTRTERAIENYLYRLHDPQRRAGKLFISMSVKSQYKVVEVADDAKAIAKKQKVNQQNVGKSFIKKLIGKMKYAPMDTRFCNLRDDALECELLYSKSLLPPKFSFKDKKPIVKDWFNKIDNVILAYTNSFRRTEF